VQDFKRCRRIFFAMLITLLIFNFHALKLAQIQLLRHKGLTAMAVEQRMEKLSLGSGRGGIYDRQRGVPPGFL
jgi:cell division protein FtsI/penicillin-binding protein 2